MRLSTSAGFLEAARVIDALTFACYRYNRQECGMSAEQLARLFPDTGAAMEARYQAEQQRAAA